MERIARSIFVLLLASCSLHGQTSRGTVSGLILDPQGAAILDAEVELKNLSTNIVRTTSTNEAGLYRFDAVDPGSYAAVVRRTGFKSYSTSGVDVGAAQVVTLDATLELGQLQEVVEVTAVAVPLQAEAPVRGGNLQTREISELPYATRNPTTLSLTLPGVVSNRYDPATQSFSVNGSRGRSNNFLLDGTDNNDISIAGQAFEVRNPGSVQEVSVQTTNYDSEFGRAAGAVVNVVTKSGTNLLHGTAGFVLDSTRDDALSSTLARDPAIRLRGHPPAGTEQQFDGTLGGPIIRDRTFFHLSFLELRQFSTSVSEVKAPTPAGRSTLLQLFPKGTNANADLLQQITAGFDGAFLPATIALGNGRPGIEFGNAIVPYAQSKRLRQYGTKIDHRLGDMDLLAGRFLIDDLVQPKGLGEVIGFPSFFTSTTQKTTSIALAYTHVFSSSIVNELRPAFTRLDYKQPLDPENPLGTTLPQITIDGVNTTSANIYGIRSNFPQGKLFNNYVLQDTMSIIRGTHSFRFGFDLMSQRARQLAPFNSRGQLVYGASSGAQTFTGLANFLDDFGGAGSAARAFGQASYYPSLFRQAYFFQDRWRATPDLTLSLGVRYEYFGTPMNVTLNPVYSGLYNVNPVTLDSPLLHPNKVNGDKNNWSPSVGIAYSPGAASGWRGWLFGNRKSSLRAGYGIGYDSYFNNMTSNIVAAAPAAASASTPSTVTAANPRGLPGLSQLLPVQAPRLTPLLQQNSVYKDLVNPYYQRWSATFQRELPSDVLVDIAYVGTKGTKLFATEDGNPLVPADLRGPVPANFAGSPQPRLDPLQGVRLIRTNGGSSSYHALQTELKRRFASGFAVSAAYTFSKLIDNTSEIFTYGGTASMQQTSVPAFFGGLQIDKGLSFYDRTHRLVFTYSYELPFARAQRGPLGRLIGGWQLLGITNFESGAPYSVLNGQDADGFAGSTYDRPNFNPAGRAGVRAVPNANSPTGYVNPDAGNAPIDPREARYIGIIANNTAARRPPGNLGRNTERGPGVKNWDITALKNTRINERFRLEFRTEFFNAFNTPMYGRVSVSPFAPQQANQTISANVFSSPAGQFLNETLPDGGGRVIRWQLRLYF